MAGTVTQLGGERTEMLAVLDRVRALVAGGEAAGVMVLWDAPDGVVSDSAGVWDTVTLVKHLGDLRDMELAAWMRGVED